MRKSWNFIFLFFLLFSGSVVAESFDREFLIGKLEKLLPGQTPDSVGPTPVPGVYQVMYGPDVYYFTKDARYFFKGSLVDTSNGTNLTRNAQAAVIKNTFAQLDEKDMVVFAPKKVEHTITVFTDIDCGYCRKLHNEMDSYNQLGIKVRYLAYPRSGPNSLSFDKAVNVWCSRDRSAAMTLAKQSKISASDLQICAENPVMAQWQLGRSMGVNGTPTIITSDGKMIPGYLPADKLIAALADKTP